MHRTEMIVPLLDQPESNGEQQRESDISKSVDHIELLCQDQVRHPFHSSRIRETSVVSSRV